ncbi:MAG TPA: hypothetical protein PKI02_12970 [Mycobacterium sp.]|nr:hypothetical protein [Mycobacterium sp.]HNP12219.1 hypothetical protein [Mycobacterium sp.]
MKTPARGILAVAVAVAATATLASPAAAAPNTRCALSTPVQEVPSVTRLPSALRTLVGPIADVGAPFNSGDAVQDPSLPFRRMIRAGHRGDVWFVWYEHGGIAYFWQAVVARVTGGGDDVTTLANAGTISDTLCTLTDGVYAGRVPPYPDGAWATESY